MPSSVKAQGTISEGSQLELGAPSLTAVLQDLMRRPNYTATPGLLSKLSGLPRATIVNWLEGRVSKPRNWSDLLKVADALRLSDTEIEALLEAAQHPPLSVLRPRKPQLVDVDLDVGARFPHKSSPLPVQLTDLIGRDDDLGRVRQLIARNDTRLVTLVGTGGVGKTRLAIAAASGLHAAFEDGIVWVPLGGLVDPAQVMAQILQALGIRETSASSAAKSLILGLQTSQVLLVLDNFEQLLGAAPELYEVLENTERIKMLVTSRAALRVRGEIEFRVAPLTLPDLTNLPPIGALEQYAAVAFFVKRAQGIRADFVLTRDNGPTVAAICARLDGLPLALELAAARAGVLNPDELLRRLESPLTLLVNGTRDSDVRQRTLRNTIAWSYALLSPEQQQIFRRLAILTGGISFAAAAVVAGVDIETNLRVSNDLFETLASLADQSLLSTVASLGEREPRFGMLETIREFVLELVSEHGELDVLQRLHAEYFLRFSELADAQFAARRSGEWLQSIQIEYENIRSALQYYMDVGDYGPGARLVAALGRYWFERGSFREARKWLECVDVASTSVDQATGAKILLYLAFVANYESDYKAGETAAVRSLDAYTKSGDPVGVAQARTALGIAAMYTGRYDEAEALFESTLRSYRELGDERGVAVELHNLGEIASECRMDFRAAEARYQESLAIFRRLGHSLNVGCTLGLLAELRAHAGDIADARKFGREALSTYRSIDNQPLIAEELTRLARFELSEGALVEARSLLRGAIEHLKMSFHARHTARAFEAFAALAVLGEMYVQAATFLGFAQKMCEEFQLPHLPASEAEHRKLVKRTSDSLRPEEFDEAFERGKTLDLVSAFEETARV